MAKWFMFYSTRESAQLEADKRNALLPAGVRPWLVRESAPDSGYWVVV